VTRRIYEVLLLYEPINQGEKYMSRQVQKIRVDLIDPDPNQPRKTKSPEYLKELGKSIASDGLNNPIALRPHPEIAGRFMIVNGECRWAACVLSGIETIEAFVRIKKYAAMSEAELLIHQIADNEQRSDMLPVETAEAYARAAALGATIKEMSEKTGKSEKIISCDVKVAGLPKICKDAINAGTLSKVVGEKIASFDTEKEMTTAYKKSIGKGTVLDQLAAIEAYRQRNAQGKLALDVPKKQSGLSKEEKDANKEAGMAYDNLYKAIARFEKSGCHNGKGEDMVKARSKKIGQMIELAKSMEKYGKKIMSECRAYEARLQA